MNPNRNYKWLSFETKREAIEVRNTLKSQGCRVSVLYPPSDEMTMFNEENWTFRLINREC